MSGEALIEGQGRAWDRDLDSLRGGGRGVSPERLPYRYKPEGRRTMLRAGCGAWRPVCLT